LAFRDSGVPPEWVTVVVADSLLLRPSSQEPPLAAYAPVGMAMQPTATIAEAARMVRLRMYFLLSGDEPGGSGTPTWATVGSGGG